MIHAPAPSAKLGASFGRAAALALAIAALGAPSVAHAQRASSHVVRVPVATAAAPSSVQTIELGAVFEGTSVTRTLEFANRTSEPATVSETRLTHGSGVVFSADNCTGRTVAPGQACTFAATATVGQAGPYLASVQLLHSANPVPDVWYLRATGLARHASLQTTPQSLSFSAVALGAQSPPQSLSVQNTGTRAVALASVSAQGGAGWQVQAADCLRELAPGASCSLQVAFAPIARGTADAHLLALLGDGTTAALAALSGAGGSGFAQFSHSLLQWLDATVGADTTPRRLTLTNAGNAALHLGASSTLAIEGGGGAFRVSASTCTGALAPAQSCTVDVLARLPDATSRAATLRVVDAGGQSQGTSVELFAQPAAAGGAGAQAALQLSAPALDFGAVQLGQSAELPLTLRSVGSAAVSVQAPTLSGAGVASFQVLNPTHCTGLLPVGHECTLSVRFTPAALPAALASLQLTSDSATPVADVTLRGEGAEPVVSLSTTALNFGSVPVGQSASLAVALQNTGSAPLALSQATTSGPFALTHNCPASLPAAASCVLDVSATPTAAQTQTGQLTLVTNAGTHNVALSATGTLAVVEASGGLVQDDGNYRLHVFASSGAFNITRAPAGSTVDVLVVGGGGGGAGNFSGYSGSPDALRPFAAAGGGGGAGGFVLQSFTLTTTGQLTVSVGHGGAGGCDAGAWSGCERGAPGGSTSVAGSPIGTSVVALGGGGGGHPEFGDGGNGGSGGGVACGYDAGGLPSRGGVGQAGQGHDGAAGEGEVYALSWAVGDTCTGGGGGGAGGPAWFQIPGAGRHAELVDEVFAQGGAGGNPVVGQVADSAPNTGNGGAGANATGRGGHGGSGIVIIRYRAR